MVMATDPVMIHQTARLIADDLGGPVEVAADVRLSFNGRISRQFTDPEVVISGAPPHRGGRGFHPGPAPGLTPGSFTMWPILLHRATPRKSTKGGSSTSRSVMRS